MFPGKMGKMLQKAQKAQAKMQEEIAAIEVEGRAGGGAVRALVDGQKAVLELKIDPEVLEEPDAEMLADLVLAAIADGHKRIDEQVQEKMQALTSMLGLPPGMGL